MKKSKVKGLIVPTIYVLVIVASFFSVSLLHNFLTKDITDQDYSKSLMKDVTEVVLKEEEKDVFIRPYVSQNVMIKTNYYENDADAASQENSLISYQNTYMPSTGVIYGCSEDFDVVASYDGTITEIKDNEILGTVVVISHNTNLTTYYYSVNDLQVAVGDEISRGDIIGKATTNKINETDNNILFEVYYQGKSLNPEKFYDLNPKDYR